MQLYISNDKTTYKYIHEDKSETAIKLLPGCNINEDRNKFSIFISSSYGCQFKCKFCYLTLKKSEYKKLNKKTILKNLKESFLIQLEKTPEIKNKYLKLCWMGMGEDGFLNPEMLYEVSIEFLDWVITKNKFVKGLDGIDLSSIIPNNINNQVEIFNKLNNEITKYPINPNNDVVVNIDIESNINKYKNRSLFRFFYSLYSFNNKTRNFLIPGSFEINKSIEFLKKLNSKNINIIFHTMFIKDVNDSDKEIDLLIKKLKELNFNYELRILRLNTCENSKLKESKKLENIIKKLQEYNIPLKVQYSSGSEIEAACGQFIILDKS